MKYSVFIGIVAVLLTACTTVNVPNTQTPTGSSSSSFSSSSSDADIEAEPTVSFFMPEDYKYIRATSRGVLLLFDQRIAYSAVNVSKNNLGESAMISIMQTRDPRILEYAAQYSPLEDVTIGGVPMQRFMSIGMGDGIGYVRKEGKDFILVEFTFPPSEEIMRQVVESVEVWKQ